MRIRLTLDIERRHPEPERTDDAARETQLDALVEHGDPHPEVDHPIGFRRNFDSPDSTRRSQRD